jgi:hypothetical protein
MSDDMYTPAPDRSRPNSVPDRQPVYAVLRLTARRPHCAGSRRTEQCPTRTRDECTHLTRSPKIEDERRRERAAVSAPPLHTASGRGGAVHTPCAIVPLEDTCHIVGCVGSRGTRVTPPAPRAIRGRASHGQMCRVSRGGSPRAWRGTAPSPCAPPAAEQATKLLPFSGRTPQPDSPMPPLALSLAR